MLGHRLRQGRRIWLFKLEDGRGPLVVLGTLSAQGAATAMSDFAFYAVACLLVALAVVGFIGSVARLFGWA
jgi:hypothetical protein